MDINSSSCNNSMDQYEKQLFELFNNYDKNHNGNLTKDQLNELCINLQLEHRGIQLIQILTKQNQNNKITFQQFRDGLLTVLGDENNDQQNNSEGDSSGRELSPKYVFGSKKYGRRSRPTFKVDSLDLITDNPTRTNSYDSYDLEGINKEKKTTKVRRSISLNEGRRGDYLDINSLGFTHLSVTRVESIECTSNSPFTELDCNSNTKPLRHANISYEENPLGQLQSGNSIEAIANQEMDSNNSIEDFVPSENIVELWESVGIARPQQLLQDLGFQNRNLKLSQVICVLEEEIKMMINSLQESSASHSVVVLFQAILCLYRCETKSLKLCLNHTSAERNKLKSDLTDANQRAILLAHEVDENHANMENIMKQNIKQLEIKHSETVKEMMEDYTTEKELSSLTISKLENRVLSMESEEIKLKSQLTSLQDDNLKLEKELNKSQEQLFELTDIKNYLTKELKTLGNERQKSQTNLLDEKDFLHLESQLAKYQTENIALKDKNDELCTELDNLKKTLAANQIKKCEDNEESHLDSFGLQLNPLNSFSSSSDPSSSMISQMETIKIIDGKDICDFVRDISMANEDTLNVEDNVTERPLELSTERLPVNDERYLNVSVNVNDKFIERTNKLIELIKNIISSNKSDNFKPYVLCLYAIIQKITSNLNCSANVNNQDEDNTPNADLSLTINNVFNEVLQFNRDNIEDDGNFDISFKYTDKSICDNYNDRSKPNENLTGQIDSLNECLKNERTERELERSKETKKYQDLETNMELLRNEFFKCEEYWSSKLNEEREIFDQEQRITDGKFTELLTKLSEYEEQFTAQDNNKTDRFDGPLSTIEEKCHLEKQFNDLEDEFQEYKTKAEDDLRLKDVEISELKDKITNLEESIKNIVNNNKNTTIENKVPDDNSITNNVNNNLDNDNSLLLNDNDNNYINSPINYLWNQKAIPSPLTNVKSVESQRDYHNPAYIKDNHNESNGPPVITPIQKPVSFKTHVSAAETSKLNVQENGDLKNGFEMKPETKMLNCSDLEEALQGRRKRPQTVEGSQIKLENGDVLNNCNNNSTTLRTVALEIHCRQLQAALRQQQAYAESVFQQTVAAHRAEMGALKQRLAAADLLVRDLYVENCHLARNISNPVFK